MILKKRFYFSIVVCLFLLFSVQAAFAEIKVINDGSPVFVSSHVLGNQIVQFPNGKRTLDEMLMGFTADKFPAKAAFKSTTNFVATAQFRSVSNAIVLTDGSGKSNLCRYEFELNLPRAGAMQNQTVQWNINFPKEGFYAFNIFIDGALVGYYPFYVWAK